jgi:hypothetical protein
VAELIASQDFKQPKESTAPASPGKMAKFAHKVLHRSKDERMKMHLSDTKVAFSCLLRHHVCHSRPFIASIATAHTSPSSSNFDNLDSAKTKQEHGHSDNENRLQLAQQLMPMNSLASMAIK